MKRTYTLLLLLTMGVFAGTGFAQINQNLPTAGYDTTTMYHPAFLQTPDGRFKVNIGMYTQFRYNMNWRQDVPDSVESFTRGYNFARTRLFFEAYLTDKFYVHFRTNINPSGNFELFVGFLQYNINSEKGMWIRLGRQFMALGREDWIFPSDLASIEFSAQDFTYAIWSNFGIQFRHVPSNKFRYFAGLGNGAYGGRRTFPAPQDSDIAFTGRTEYNIIGEGWGNWDDIVGRPGREFGMMVGLGLGHQIRRKESDLSENAKSGSQVNLDFNMAGDGFHFFTHATFTNRRYDAEFNTTPDFSVWSFYGSFTYWLNDHWMPYIRYDYAGNGDSPFASENYSAPGLGITYYPFRWTYRTRFTIEYNYLNGTINNTVVQPDGQLGWVESDFGSQHSLRLQAQFGF